MGWVVLVLLALTCAVLQHGWLAQLPIAPDLPLALLAWMIVDGTDEGVLPRAFAVGLIRDCVDPGSVSFHTVAYCLVALAFLPARGLVFRTRAAGWATLAFLASMALGALDRALTGGDADAMALLAAAILTAIATLLGWPFQYAPRILHPAGRGGA